jgi:hypothetical protein
MKDQQKYILLGLVGVGGLAYWYFFYGPGMTPAVVTTGPAATGTPAAVAPSANGSTVPVPASVQAFVNSWGPKSQALWASLIPTLSASTVSAQYANLVQILPYWSSNTVAPAALDTAVDNWFNANGFTNLSA